MERSDIERKHTTILAASVAGYARLASEDNAEALARLNAHRENFV